MTGGPASLLDEFGHIDIYLFDQLLRGRIQPGMRVLDAACGTGRNLVYLLRRGFDVWAVDRDPQAVAIVRTLAAELAPTLPPDRFRVEAVERMSVPSATMDVVVCNSVLHFATSHAHFDAIVADLWRVLKPGGVLFCRLASTIGIGHLMTPLGDGRYTLPDGATWYLVDEQRLMTKTAELAGQWLDPLKTTVVQDRRSMSTWVIRKTHESS